jgi:hypothetical protein
LRHSYSNYTNYEGERITAGVSEISERIQGRYPGKGRRPFLLKDTYGHAATD